jgi:predicted lipoprotein with Yx(FWY)xxD motif
MGALLAALGTKLIPVSRQTGLANRSQAQAAPAAPAVTQAPAAGYDTGNGGTGAAPAATDGAAPAPANGAPANGAPAAAPTGVTTKSLTGKAVAKMGKVVVDDNGWILYRFDKDTASPPTSNCVDKCAAVWPPMLVEEGGPALEGLQADQVGAVTRADGGRQVTLNGWPLYRYVGDKEPGQWKGQAVGGTWFVVAPDGKKNLTCLPTSTPTAAAPPEAGAPDGGGGTY